MISHHPAPETQDTAIVQINRAEIALSRANDIHEMIELRSYGAAAEMLANARGFKDAAQQAKIFQLKAERKAGAWLAENVSAGNPQLSQDGIIATLPEGVDAHESHRWQLEASLPEEKFNAWIDESLAHGWEISAGGLRRIASNHAGKVAETTPLQRAVDAFLREADKVRDELTPAQVAAAEAVKEAYS